MGVDVECHRVCGNYKEDDVPFDSLQVKWCPFVGSTSRTSQWSYILRRARNIRAECLYIRKLQDRREKTKRDMKVM